REVNKRRAPIPIRENFAVANHWPPGLSTGGNQGAVMLARRATPMYLVSDLEEARSNYEALGFEPKPTNDIGCLGVIAGSTSVILVDREYAERTLPQRAVILLEQK